MYTDEQLEQLSAYVDGQLSAGEREELERALAADAGLRQRLEELQSLSATLKSLPRQSLPRPLVDDVLACLDAPTPARSHHWGRWAAWGAIAAVAASLLVIVAPRWTTEPQLARDTTKKQLPQSGSNSVQTAATPAPTAAPMVAAESTVTSPADAGALRSNSRDSSPNVAQTAAKPAEPTMPLTSNARPNEAITAKTSAPLDVRIADGAPGAATSAYGKFEPRPTYSAKSLKGAAPGATAVSPPVQGSGSGGEVLLVRVAVARSALEGNAIRNVFTANAVELEAESEAVQKKLTGDDRANEIRDGAHEGKPFTDLETRNGSEAAISSDGGQGVEMVYVEAPPSQVAGVVQTMQKQSQYFSQVAVGDLPTPASSEMSAIKAEQMTVEQQSVNRSTLSKPDVATRSFTHQARARVVRGEEQAALLDQSRALPTRNQGQFSVQNQLQVPVPTAAPLGEKSATAPQRSAPSSVQTADQPASRMQQFTDVERSVRSRAAEESPLRVLFVFEPENQPTTAIPATTAPADK